ncbi:MAG: hypothetical protein H8E15_02430 [Planctomycetes bacterium]|nr:hypothetical protein [Planctomycetota bacterium]
MGSQSGHAIEIQPDGYFSFVDDADVTTLIFSLVYCDGPIYYFEQPINGDTYIDLAIYLHLVGNNGRVVAKFYGLIH